MPTIHLSAHHSSGKRLLAVGQDDRNAKVALFACVARADIKRSFTITSEYFALMRHLKKYEKMVGEPAIVITQDSEEWSLRREVFQNETIYELDDWLGVKTFQL